MKILLVTDNPNNPLWEDVIEAFFPQSLLTITDHVPVSRDDDVVIVKTPGIAGEADYVIKKDGSLYYLYNLDWRLSGIYKYASAGTFYYCPGTGESGNDPFICKDGFEAERISVDT